MQASLRSYTDGTQFDPDFSLLTYSVLRVRKCMPSRSLHIEEAVSRLGNIVEWCMMLRLTAAESYYIVSVGPEYGRIGLPNRFELYSFRNFDIGGWVAS